MQSLKRLDPLRGAVRSIVAGDLIKRFDEKGPQGAYEYTHEYLERLNIETDFVKKKDERFPLWRERLNTARGIMISNHPSLLDAPLLSQALTRDDAKLVVNQGLYKRVEGSSLQQMFIPAAKDSLSEAKEMISSIRSILSAGGLIWIFPTGGQEIDNGHSESLRFAPGFAHILNELSPEDMVYSFHINTEDLRPVSSALKINTSFLSGEFLPEELNIARRRDITRVRIDELYSSAKEWQDVLRGVGKKERNEALTKHYLEQFSLDKSELEVLSRG